ncbi:hypothetical protein [Chitinophaga parva]|uniref:hypothetical protein n=1 Tax=Chitinophaga parva TaxID=2169414 RepID=UPI000D3EC1B1|nr:hypothetical protein [Chitinophaga parva]
MRKSIAIVLLIVLDILAACRSNKVGCPQPRSQWGAEKVLEEMSKPKKGSKTSFVPMPAKHTVTV